LCAARLQERAGAASAGATQALDQALRQAFFAEGADIGRTSVVMELIGRSPFDRAAIAAALDDGTAHAALAADQQLAVEQQVRASPTLIFNDGRQTLTGNVGYRVLEANVRELLRNPAGQQSWC
jgi:predicted DsbA family dithiol-disulfide isomerase